MYTYLRDLYGGHPYLIRLACSELWRSSDVTDPEHLAKISIAQFEGMRPQIRARLTQPIRDILLSLVWWYPDEYDILRILASGDRGFVTDYLSSQPEGIIQFAKYGILRTDGEFAMADIRDFLNQFGQAYKNEISPFARTDMPPALLPEIPNLEVLGALFKKRCEVEVLLRRAILLYIGIKEGWSPDKIATTMLKGLKSRSDRPNPADLFVGRTPQQAANELYTLELKQIISANWELFSSLFDTNKTRFEMNMDTINRARRVDAHTKPLTSLDIAEFENSYEWAKARLSKIQNT